MSRTQRLYFVAGEASGDAHGAALMKALRELQPKVVLSGRGGPRMHALGEENFIDWSTESAVLGLWEVLKKYGYFRRQFAAARKEIRAQRPDAVVLIDYPGFNLRLARALRAELPRLKILYYISPQVWAWNRRRIPEMAKYLDLMLCIFPFEAALYNQSGLRTVFVGHPMADSLNADAKTDRDPDLIGLFPGSRSREVRKIFPIMVQTAELIRAQRPNSRFEVAAASEFLAKEISAISNGSMRIIAGETREIMQRAAVGIIASGTATLEAAFLRLPFVLVYRVAWLTYFAARLLVKVPHLGMPNVLAGREIVPEFIQHRAQPRAIAAAVVRLLRDQRARESIVAEFDGIVATLDKKDASMTAARAILDELREVA